MTKATELLNAEILNAEVLDDIRKTAKAIDLGWADLPLSDWADLRLSDWDFLPAPPLMSKRDVARRLGCSVVTVNRLLRAGAIGSARVGRQVRFSELDLAEYLSRQKRPAKGLSK